jgi:hypothetical protein
MHASTTRHSPWALPARARRSVALLVVALQGCSGGQDDGARGNAEVLAGAPACAFTQIATSAKDALFSEITALATDSRGRIYVGDLNRAEVSVLAGDGTLLRTLGKSGKGPGEFKWINDVQVLPGDSLLVYDRGLGRITVFAPASDTVAYTVDLAAASRLLPPASVVRLAGRQGYVGTVIEPFRASGDDPRQDYEREQVVRLLALDGSVTRDSVLVLRAGQDILTARTGRSVTAMPNPFGRPGEVKVGPGGRLYYGWGDSLSISIYSSGGQRAGGFSLPYERPPVTDEDIRGTFASESEARQFQPAVRSFVDTYASGTWPAFRTFSVDDRGRIWIGLLAPAGEPTKWTAFDDEGTPVCSAALPANTSIYAVRGDRAYSVATDELDVPRVVVHRIEGLETGTRS